MAQGGRRERVREPFDQGQDPAGERDRAERERDLDQQADQQDRRHLGSAGHGVGDRVAGEAQ